MWKNQINKIPKKTCLEINSILLGTGDGEKLNQTHKYQEFPEAKCLHGVCPKIRKQYEQLGRGRSAGQLQALQVAPEVKLQCLITPAEVGFGDTTSLESSILQESNPSQLIGTLMQGWVESVLWHLLGDLCRMNRCLFGSTNASDLLFLNNQVPIQCFMFPTRHFFTLYYKHTSLLWSPLKANTDVDQDYADHSSQQLSLCPECFHLTEHRQRKPQAQLGSSLKCAAL